MEEVQKEGVGVGVRVLALRSRVGEVVGEAVWEALGEESGLGKGSEG